MILCQVHAPCYDGAPRGFDMRRARDAEKTRVLTRAKARMPYLECEFRYLRQAFILR